MAGFGFLAYDASKKGRQTGMILYIALSLLFQPLLKIALGSVMWNIVDVVVAVGLIISIFKKPIKV